MKVKVVHMRNYGKSSKKLGVNEVYIYCGRPSKLGNPYNKWNNGSREENIEACRVDNNWNAVLDEFIVWVKAHKYNDIKLGCFCAPKACHCDIIKERIDKEYVQ